MSAGEEWHELMPCSLLQVEAAQADIFLQVYLASQGSSASSSTESSGRGEAGQQQQQEEQQEQQQPEAAQAAHSQEQQQPEAAQAAHSQEQEQQQQAAEQAAEASSSSAAESQQPADAPGASEAVLPQQAEQQEGDLQQQQGGGLEEEWPQQQQGEDKEQQEEPAAAQGTAPPLPGPEPEPPGRHLREFLELLVTKNHGAMRHIPPPGLSDQTALASAVFALLRLMNEQARGGLQGPWAGRVGRGTASHELRPDGKWATAQQVFNAPCRLSWFAGVGQPARRAFHPLGPHGHIPRGNTGVAITWRCHAYACAMKSCPACVGVALHICDQPPAGGLPCTLSCS